MIYEFETRDNEKFVLDIESGRWGRASSILAAPSVQASERAMARYVYVEEGDLIPMGGGVYNLDGRQPLPDKPTEEQLRAPGAGLSTVGVLIVLYGEVCELYLKPNVQIKDGSFNSAYLRELEPNIRNRFLRHNILQEPPKVQEDKKIIEETQ